MILPPYIKETSYCTSGTIVRDSLLTEWVIVTCASGTKYKAYYHYHHGWIIEGLPVGAFRHGYIPLTQEVISWNKIK